MSRVPTSIDREDFLVAVKPLLDLLGVTAAEIYPDVLIAKHDITFTMVADLEGVEYPAAVHPQGHEVGQVSEWTFPISVALT